MSGDSVRSGGTVCRQRSIAGAFADSGDVLGTISVDGAPAEESERLRKALGISADYEEGSHWRKQEERMRDSLAKREAEDEERTAKAKEARRYDEGDSD